MFKTICIIGAIIGGISMMSGGQTPSTAQAGSVSAISVSGYQFIAKAVKAGIPESKAQVISDVATEIGVAPQYIGAIGLTESILNPDTVGDNGCSFGAYQNNLCANPQVKKECVTDFTCSTQNLAKWIKMKNCQASNWISCLSKWNGNNPPDWYTIKIQNNGQTLGL